MLKRVLGIDLGTTTTCVSIFDGEKVDVLSSSDGQALTPSVVLFTPSGGRLVGEYAVRQASMYPHRTVAAVKRLIGRSFESACQVSADGQPSIVSRLSYEVREAKGESSGSGRPEIVVEDQSYSPEFISALILEKVVADANTFLGCEGDNMVKDVVITVPAHFSVESREATKMAAKIAKLNVLRILNEPTAAALAFGNAKEIEGKMLVYDLGGGTFDVSIVEKTLVDGENEDGSLYVVVTSNGDRDLGGEDVDNVLADYACKHFTRQNNGKKIETGTIAYYKVKQAAKHAKEVLSNLDSASINLPHLIGDAHLNVDITLDIMNNLINGMIDTSIKIVKAAMEEASVSADDLTAVILVGGSTRLKLVRQKLTQLFGEKKIRRDVHPDQAVSFGAAIHGYSISNKHAGVALVDVVTQTIGIEALGGLMEAIVVRNSALPVTQKKTFSTVYDNQEAAHIAVYRGERTMVKDNILLGAFVLKDLPKMPRGVPQIDVSVTINQDGLMKVEAFESTSKAKSSVEIAPTRPLTKEELKKMDEESARFREHDQKEKKRVELQNTFFMAEQQLSGNLSKVSEDKKKEFEDKYEALRTKFNDKEQEYNFEVKQKVIDDLYALNVEVLKFVPKNEGTESVKEAKVENTEAEKPDTTT